MLLPTFVFFALFARYQSEIAAWFRMRVSSGRLAWKLALALILAGGGLGTLYEAAAMGLWSAATCSLSWRIVGREPPAWVGLLEEIDSRRIARDRGITRLAPSLVSPEQRRVLTGAETLMGPVPPEELTPWELEIARQPRRGYFR